jgi:PAS domain S-box-containing protein
MSASKSGTTSALGPEDEPEGADTSTAPPPPAADPTGTERLLGTLLDGMDAAFCAFDAEGVITHWNREAARILGWSAREAVGRHGFAGWAVRTADAAGVEERLLAVMDAPGRQVHEFALLRKDGGRVLVRTQSARVLGIDGEPAGLYCAFSEVHAQIDLERSIALSEALFDDATWGVVLVDVDLRPTVVNGYAARALGAGRNSPLGRPLGELLTDGVEQLEGSLQYVLAEGPPRAFSDLWLTVALGREGRRRRCLRSGFLRLASPLAGEPVPLGVAWLFHDVTESKLAEQEADRLRFRSSQLHRAARAAADCENPMEAATTYLDFALAGFADHALIDLLEPGGTGRLVRTAATPAGAPGPVGPVTAAGIPVRYRPGHPALQAADRSGPVRASSPADAAAAATWSKDLHWPADMRHALCTPLRSRGRTLGVLTFLRSPARAPFERPDTVYAESMAVLAASALDLAALTEATDP